MWSGCLSVYLAISLSLSYIYLSNSLYLLDREIREREMERNGWMDRDNRAALCSPAAPLLACCCCCWQHTGMVMMSLVGCAYAKRACWALSCCCCSLLLLPQPHAHTLVCVRVAAAVAAVVVVVGQAPLGRSVVGIVCLWVRVGVHRGYIYIPTVHTHKRADRRSPGRDIYFERERDSVSVCVCACVSIVYIYIYICNRYMHAHAH